MPTSAAVRISVEGRPAPKGSRIQQTTRTGHSFTRPASKYEAPWIKAVKHATELQMRHHRQVPPPYAVHIDIIVASPQKRSHDWPSLHDLDKLARSTIDGLVKGGALSDDRHVIELHARKLYASDGQPPGAIAIVATVPP